MGGGEWWRRGGLSIICPGPKILTTILVLSDPFRDLLNYRFGFQNVQWDSVNVNNSGYCEQMVFVNFQYFLDIFLVSSHHDSFVVIFRTAQPFPL